jgi:NNP family nitrate/nitrite transporter-like MFS transporter
VLQDVLFYMGIMIIAVTSTVSLLYFPQWGGMIFPARKGPTATEVAHYSADYTKEEWDQGLHDKALKFAENSRGERGPGGVWQRPAAPSTEKAANGVGAV